MILYHASATENRDSILKLGLLTAKDQTGLGAVYLSDKLPNHGSDVWRVDCTGLALEQDWTTEQDEVENGRWWMSFRDVLPSRLMLLAGVAAPVEIAYYDIGGIGMSAQDPKLVAEQFIDAAPENAMSVEEYVWEYRMLNRQDLVDTGLLRDFAAHARNIALDPAKSDLSRPVVVSVGDGERDRVAVWDGVHRIMSALHLGHDKLPAFVGTRKPEFSPAPPVEVSKPKGASARM